MEQACQRGMGQPAVGTGRGSVRRVHSGLHNSLEGPEPGKELPPANSEPNVRGLGRKKQMVSSDLKPK